MIQQYVNPQKKKNMFNLFDFLEDLEKALLLIGRGNKYIVYIVSFLLNFRI